MKKNQKEIMRVQNMLNNDRANSTENFNNLVLKDIDNVLRDYFEYKDKPLFSVEKSGGNILVNISLNAFSVKTFSVVPKNEIS